MVRLGRWGAAPTTVSRPAGALLAAQLLRRGRQIRALSTGITDSVAEHLRRLQVDSSHG